MNLAAQDQLSAAELFEQRFALLLAQRSELADLVGARIRIHVVGEGAGQWDLDLTKRPGALCTPQGAPSCSITVHSADLPALLGKELSPHVAFMSGRIKVGGDVRAAVRLGALFA